MGRLEALPKGALGRWFGVGDDRTYEASSTDGALMLRSIDPGTGAPEEDRRIVPGEAPFSLDAQFLSDPLLGAPCLLYGRSAEQASGAFDLWCVY